MKRIKVVSVPVRALGTGVNLVLSDPVWANLPARPTLKAGLVEAMAEGARLAASALSASTEEKYESHWNAFEAWANDQKVVSLPVDPHVLVAYVGYLKLEGLLPASVDAALSAISMRHVRAGLPSPRQAHEVKDARRGHRREVKTEQRGARAVSPDELSRMIGALPLDLRGARDRALILVGFTAGLRRSEVAALNVKDLRFVDGKGVIVTVRSSKTDQEGRGEPIAVHERPGSELCPVRALRDWLAQSGVTRGALFRSLREYKKKKEDSGWVKVSGRLGGDKPGPADRGKDVGRILKRAAVAAGLDPALVSGHSLRAGFVTTACRRTDQHEPASRAAVKAVTRHASDTMVNRYEREAQLFDDDPLKGAL